MAHPCILARREILMTEKTPEDEAFDELEKKLKKHPMQNDPVYRATIAAAEFINDNTAEILAITNIRQAFVYGYRTGWRDKEGEK